MPYFAYRIVKSDPPDPGAFRSHAERGDRPPIGISPQSLNAWDGVSVFETREQAARHATKFSHLGRYIAELRIPDDAPISRDSADERGHFNLRATGAVISKYVTRVTSL